MRTCECHEDVRAARSLAAVLCWASMCWLRVVTSVARTSSIVGALLPSSDCRLQTGRLCKPQGTMVAKCRRSVVTLMARPCMLIQRRTRTPMAQSLASWHVCVVVRRPVVGSVMTQTPVAVVSRCAGTPNVAHVSMTVCSSSRMYAWRPRLRALRSRMG